LRMLSDPVPWLRLARAAGICALALLCLGQSPLPSGPPTPDSLDVGRKWMDEGEYERVESLARRQLARLKNTRHAPPAERATALDLLVESLWRQGYATREDTQKLAGQALTLRDTSLASLDSSAARALLNLGAIRAQTADYEGAR